MPNCFSIAVMSTKGKNPHAVALGHLGGKKSGALRMVNLTPRQRKEIARKAALARWRKRK